jgi:filamentous hemagglutinin family protein
MPATFGSRCKVWLARLLIWVMGFQEVAWAIPLPSIIEPKNATPFLHKSSMDKAPNGVDLLQTFPSDTFGTFFQPYHQFNVGEAGLIFNNFPGLDPNTLSPVSGKIGGAILENPLLKGKQAALRIVQSIEGGAPTRLSGPLEVYGPQTELILANPVGFVLDRVSFLNMSKVTLITGKVRVDEDGFLGFVDVQDQGSIQANFDEGYLDRVGQLNLISSLIKLSGETTLPTSTHMKVLSGVGAYDLQEETLQPLQTVLQGGLATPPPPAFGIDAKAMGGLKAGSAYFEVLQSEISLIAPQILIASRGNLHLTAQGQVQLGNLEAKNIFAASYKDQICLKAGGLVKAGQDVTLFSKRDWIQPEQHSLVAGGAVTLTSDAGMTFGGKVQAQGILDVSAKILTQGPASMLQAKGDVQLSVLRGEVVQSGVITSLGGALSLSAGTFSQAPTAVLQAQGHTTLKIDQQMTLEGSIFSHGGLLTLLGADLTQEQGLLYGKTGVVLTSVGPLVTLGDVTSHGSLKVMGMSWTHELLGGEASAPLSTVYARDGIDIKITEAFQLRSKVEAGGALTVSAKQVDIQETGSLQGHKGVHLQTSEKLTTAGAISSDQGTVKLIAPLWHQTRGKVEGQVGGTVNVDTLTTWGAISSLTGALFIQVKSWVHRLVKILGKESPNAIQGAKGVTVVAETSVELKGSIKAISGKLSLAAPTFRLKRQGGLSGNDGVVITASKTAETFGNITSSDGNIVLTTPTWLHDEGVVKGSKGIEVKVGQTCEIEGSLNSAEGKITLKTKKMDVTNASSFLGHGGVEIAVETPWQYEGDIISKAGKIRLQAPSFHHTHGSLSGHQGVEFVLNQTSSGFARLQDVVSKAGIITVKAHTVTQTGTELKGARGVVLKLTGSANVDRVVSRDGKVEITADTLKRGVGNVIQGTQGITLNLKQALATRTHFISPKGTLALSAPSFQLGGTLQGKDIKITGTQGIDVGSEVVANTLWIQAPEVQVCPQGFVAASDIQLRGDRFALQGTMLSNSYNFLCKYAIYVAPSGKWLPIPQEQPQFIPQRLAQGPLLVPKEVSAFDKLSFDPEFRGISYAGTVKTGGSLNISGSQVLIPPGGACETGGKLTVTTTGNVENEGNLLSQGGMEVKALIFLNRGSLGVVGKATFQGSWLQRETGTTGVSGDLETTGNYLINKGQLDVGGNPPGPTFKRRHQPRAHQLWCRGPSFGW